MFDSIKNKYTLSLIVLMVVGIIVGLFYLQISAKEMRWPVGFTVIIIYLSLLSISNNKKKFLLASLIITCMIRTNVNLWMPTPSYYSTGSGTTSTAIELFAFDPPLILLALYLLIERKAKKNTSFKISDIAAMLFILFTTLSIVNCEYPFLAIVRLPVLLRMPLIYYCLSRGVMSKQDVNVVAQVLIFCIMLQSFLAIAQTYFGTFAWLGSIVERTDQVTTVQVGNLEVGRATGTIGYTTVFAQYMGMLSPIALSFFVFSSSNRNQLIALTAYVLSLLALFLSRSRAEFINLPIVFLLILIMAVYKRKFIPMNILKISSVLGAMIVIFSIYSETIIGRFILPDEDSAYSRIPMNRIAVNVIKSNPVFGVGLHNYTHAMHKYGIDKEIPNMEFGVHNTFLYIAAETGIINLFFILFLWFTTYKRLLYCLKNDDTSLWIVAAGLMCGLTALFIHSNVEEGFHVHQVLSCMLWSYFGLAAALKSMVVSEIKAA